MKLIRKHAYLIAIPLLILVVLHFYIRGIPIVQTEKPLSIHKIAHYSNKIRVHLMHSDGSIPDEIIVDFLGPDFKPYDSRAFKLQHSENGSQYFKIVLPSRPILSYGPPVVSIRQP